MKHFIFQGNNHDCGFASLKMLLATLANDDSYLHIAKPDNKKGGYSLKELIDIARSFNVELEGSTCDDEYLNHLKGPCLALVNNNHVVLIKKAHKKFLLIYDPGEGIFRCSKKKFKSIWSRILLEVSDSKSIAKIRKIKNEILPLKMRLTQALISFISVALLITCLFFLNDSQNIWFSVLFLIGFLVSQILENYYLYRQINYFDEKYINSYFSIKSNKNKNKYLEFLNFKQNYFVKSRSILLSILLAFSITFILCFNDFRNILILLIIILVKLLEIILSTKTRKRDVEEIGEYEKKGFENPSSMINNLLLANYHSNIIMFKTSIKNIIYMAFCFLLSLLMMKVTNSEGCNFVIFHFVIYYAAYKSFEDMLTSLSNKKSRYKQECEFIDSCNL